MKRLGLLLALGLTLACATSSNSLKGRNWQIIESSELPKACVGVSSGSAISFSAYVEAEFGGSGAGGDAVALVGAEGKFYLEFTGPFGAQAIIASDGKLLYVWDVRGKVMAVSPALRRVSVLVDLPVSALEFTHLLQACLPCAGRQRGFRFSDGSEQIVELWQNRLYVLETNHEAVPRKYALVEDGRVKLLAEYFGNAPILRYSAIRIKLDNGISVTVKIRPDSVKRLTDIADTTFVPHPPPFVRRVYGVLKLTLPHRTNR